MCSGTALLSGNKSVVWTAGHCVNEGPGDFATNWEFVPAYKDGSAPLGVYVAEDLVTRSAWANSGDFSYDFGAAIVGPAGGTALTDRVGGRGITFNYSRSQTYNSYGYPAAPPFTGERLWRCNSPLQTSDNSANPPTMGIGCDMTGGSSGGGWIVGNNVYVGQLVRLLEPAGRHVRAVPGQRRPVGLQRRRGGLGRVSRARRVRRPAASASRPSPQPRRGDPTSRGTP